MHKSLLKPPGSMQAMPMGQSPLLLQVSWQSAPIGGEMTPSHSAVPPGGGGSQAPMPTPSQRVTQTEKVPVPGMKTSAQVPLSHASTMPQLPYCGSGSVGVMQT